MENRAAVWRCIVPSCFGVLFFLIPIRVAGRWTILMAAASDGLTALVGDAMPWIVLVILALSAVLSVCIGSGVWVPRGWPERLVEPFRVGWLWISLRLFGLIIAAATCWQIGPEWVWGEASGHVVFYDLAPALLTIFLFAAVLLPLLTDYGLMEFVGTVLRRPFEVVFGLPGRAAIDALASWLVAAAVGILITSQQYAGGYYSRREAMVIATNFSVVSLPFCVLIVNLVGLGDKFIPYYLSVVAIGLLAAVVLPRLPPLSRISDSYNPQAGRQIHEKPPREVSVLRWGWRQALAKAASAQGARGLLRGATFNIADIWFGLLPLVIAIGWLGMVLVEYTQVLHWLSYPYIYLLEALRLPEAEAAAPAMVVGFADMFLPAVLAKGIESEVTRFAIAIVSVTQLIYMSEVGVLLLRKLPFHLGHLVALFVIRTLVSLPPAALAAHLIV